MELPQNVTFVSFDRFYRESDVRNYEGDYIFIKTFCTPILRSILWVVCFKNQKYFF